MAFSFPWASSAGTDFNYDFHTTHTTEQQRSGTGELNFRPVGPQPEPQAGEDNPLAFGPLLTVDYENPG